MIEHYFPCSLFDMEARYCERDYKIGEFSFIIDTESIMNKKNVIVMIISFD